MSRLERTLEPDRAVRRIEVITAQCSAPPSEPANNDTPQKTIRKQSGGDVRASIADVSDVGISEPGYYLYATAG